MGGAPRRLIPFALRSTAGAHAGLFFIELPCTKALPGLLDQMAVLPSPHLRVETAHKILQNPAPAVATRASI